MSQLESRKSGVNKLSEQTVMDRYHIGEPVARFGSATAPIFQAFDIALNRDVWIETYKIEDHATKSWMYDWIRKQVIMNNSNLQSVYDVFDDHENIYVVGESLSSYTTFKSYLDKTEEQDTTVLKRILQVLSIIIDISKTLHNSYQLSLERVLIYQDTIKIIPRCQKETVFAHKGKMQAFLFLQMVHQSTRRAVMQEQIEKWLHHAERHMQIIDSVDLQLWMDELDKIQENGGCQKEKHESEEDLATRNPTVSLDQDASHKTRNAERGGRSQTKPYEASAKRSPMALATQPKNVFQKIIHWIMHRPMWLRILVATCILLAGGWFGYNALNPTVVIPDLTGKSYMEAVHTLEKLGIDPTKIERIDTLGSTQKAGLIFAQDPQAGSRARLSSSITLQVSKGSPKITVPKVAGSTIKQAKDALVQAGLSPSAIQVTGGSNSDNDIVTSVTPPSGSEVQSDQTVVLDANSASAPAGNSVVVPNLSGLSLNQAINVLLKDGLRYYYEYHAASAPSHTVFQQSIEPGQLVDKGTRVTFYVAQ
jgi:beta-lactam-binding protein with PASTA domain